jgi:hypothetical protein
VEGRMWESVMPTMPQPAPSSRILRLGRESVCSNNGSCGSEVVDDAD